MGENYYLLNFTSLAQKIRELIETNATMLVKVKVIAPLSPEPEADSVSYEAESSSVETLNSVPLKRSSA